MKLLRENMNHEFKIIYQQPERMATKLSVEPAIPRTVLGKCIATMFQLKIQKNTTDV